MNYHQFLELKIARFLEKESEISNYFCQVWNIISTLIGSMTVEIGT